MPSGVLGELSLKGFPSGSDSKQSVSSVGEPSLIPGSGRSPEEGNGNPTPVFFPGKCYGQRSLGGWLYSPWGHKESETTEWLHFQEFLITALPSKLAVSSSRRPQFNSWVGKIHWGRDRLPTPAFLGFPGGSAGKESACHAGDLGSIPGLGRSPGEETSSILAWRIPWTVQSTGSQRVGHDWATFTFMFHLVRCLPQTRKQLFFKKIWLTLVGNGI